MGKLASKMYERYDKSIVGSANAIVRGWNWFSGETKEDLVKKIYIVTPFFNGIISALKKYNSESEKGVTINQAVGYGATMGLVWGGLSFLTWYKAKHLILDKEKELGDKPLKSLEVEHYKERSKKFTIPFFSSASTLEYVHSENPLYAIAGIEPIILAEIVLCADNVPPRKNCFSRGYDKLRTFVQENKPQIATQRAYSELESQII